MAATLIEFNPWTNTKRLFRLDCLSNVLLLFFSQRTEESIAEKNKDDRIRPEVNTCIFLTVKLYIHFTDSMLVRI